MLSDTVRAAHEELSERNLDFLSFVERNPACLERASFEALAEQSELVPYPLQSWPTFVRGEMVDRMGQACFLVCELIKTLPWRVWEGAPARIAEIYGIDPRRAALLCALLENDDYLDALLARGDFVNTASGLKCLEVNWGGNLGGWKAPVWAQRYTEVPLFQRFIRESGVVYRHRDPVQSFFVHAIDTALRTGLLDDGEINIAFLVHESLRSGSDVQRYVDRELQRTLRENTQGVGGTVVVCDESDLALHGARLFHQGRRIHAVVEHTFDLAARHILNSLMAGQVNVYNGPATEVFSDKRNLAFLSELQDSGLFDDEERSAVAEHVPWTRVLLSGPTIWRGEPVQLTELLRAERERLVIKPANGAKGEGVILGRLVSPDAWAKVVDAALADSRPWVVQERVESLPYLYQHGEQGCAEHDLIWGFFNFGTTYAGGFLRMMPKADNRGVVNAAQGATEGVLMEVDR